MLQLKESESNIFGEHLLILEDPKFGKVYIIFPMISCIHKVIKEKEIKANIIEKEVDF